MPARVIDGRKIAAEIRAEVKETIQKDGLDLTIVSILAGGDDASKVYIKQKEKACKEVGIKFEVKEIMKTSTLDMMLHEIRTTARDTNVVGMVVELPLPANLNLAKITPTIPPDMDLDGLNPANHGRLVHGHNCLAPSTPLAVMELLEREDIDLQGAEVTVVSHSNIVGKPLSLMLLHRNASLKVAHEFTKDLKSYTQNAEVLITAAGVPGLIEANMVRDGATVIDVAMNRVDGKLCGDVDYGEVAEKAAAITPVPGGVGPVTVAMLLKNALQAYGLQNP